MSFIEKAIAHEGKTITLTVQGDRSGRQDLRLDDEPAGGFTVVHEEDGTLVLATEDGRRLRGVVRRTRDAVHVAVGGRAFVFPFVSADGDAGDDAGVADGDIVAPMTGTVLELRCEVGQQLAAGDPVVTVEAMKMEHRLDAPASATVEAIEVAAGDKVEIGQLLVRLALEEGED